jgi:phosphoribosylanthranilate isomerase
VVAARVKFCGLTRAVDARCASDLGAAYAGVIFAGGPRQVTPAAALAALDAAEGEVRRVGVFAGAAPEAIAETAHEARLDVVQLHADPDERSIEAVRRLFGGEIWAVLRCRGRELPAGSAAVFAAADGVVLDALVDGRLGGTGVVLDWAELRAPLDRLRGSAAVVLAGGLRAENVARAVVELAPDVVDVSSGVELSPGIKDHGRMQAFVRAVRGASISA